MGGGGVSTRVCRGDYGDTDSAFKQFVWMGKGFSKLLCLDFSLKKANGQRMVAACGNANADSICGQISLYGTVSESFRRASKGFNRMPRTTLMTFNALALTSNRGTI